MFGLQAYHDKIVQIIIYFALDDGYYVILNII